MLSNKEIEERRIVLRGPSRDAVEMPPLQIVRLLISLILNLYLALYTRARALYSKDCLFSIR